jgi:hypothetical protein
MTKREREREERTRAWWAQIAADAEKADAAFEASLNAPESDYRLATYRVLLHKAILHFARDAFQGGNYDKGYFLRDSVDRAAQFMAIQMKLAALSHKVTFEYDRLDRMSLAQRRRNGHRSFRSLEQPHASQDEPDKHLYGAEGPHAHVLQSALRRADEER